MAIDPVCGMNVKEDTPFVTNYDGNEYYYLMFRRMQIVI
ncbi:MAG: YHS domain-containing protein [Nitrososphaerota archaeon]